MAALGLHDLGLFNGMDRLASVLIERQSLMSKQFARSRYADVARALP